jgi:putative membrane protein
MEFLYILGIALVGTLIGIIFSWIPALHIYNILALFIFIQTGTHILPPELIPYFFSGCIVGYAFAGVIPAIYFSTNDDTTLFYLLPAQKYLMYGRGHEAVLLSLTGSMFACFFILISAFFLPNFLPVLKVLLTPHIPWILASITAFMLLSEWPRTTDRAKTKIGRLKEAWGSLFMGILVFFLSGMLGYIVMRGGVLDPESNFQSLMPVFLGLFAIPWLVMNIVSNPKIPEQNTDDIIKTNYPKIIRGSFAGILGGGLAAFFPVITGGIGAFLAGHATAQRGDDVFIIGQGANRFLYYVGGFLLFFVPFLHIRRGGAAWMLNIMYSPRSYSEYFLMVGIILLSSILSFFITLYISKIIAKNINKISYNLLSFLIIVLIFTLTLFITGIRGVMVLIVASGIGLLPPLFGTRRLNCLGALLFPLTIQMSGFSESFSKLVGF